MGYTMTIALSSLEMSRRAWICRRSMAPVWAAKVRVASASAVATAFSASAWICLALAERSARATAERRGVTPEQVWEDRAALYRPGRVATPREVAEMIAFFASEESSGVSGEAVRVALGSIS